MGLDEAARRVARMACDRPGVGRLAHEILVARARAPQIQIIAEPPPIRYIHIPPPPQPRGKYRR